MSRLAEILDDCLVQLQQGEVTVEECLAKYPDYAAELRPLLATAKRLKQGRTITPSSGFRARTRAQLIAHASAHPPRRNWFRKVSGWQLPTLLGQTVRLVASIAAILLLFLTTGAVLAQSATPDDALYRWRLASEKFLWAVHPDPLRFGLLIAERQVEDITEFEGDPATEKLVLQNYQQTLAGLSTYQDPVARRLLTEALSEQRADLERADVSVPKLDELLGEVNNYEADLQVAHRAVNIVGDQLTYSLTITNQGPTSHITATLVDRLSPVETLLATNYAGCTVSEANEVVCEVIDLAVNRFQELQITTQIDMCYEGAVINTATVTYSADTIAENNRSVVEKRVTPVVGNLVAYVQSNGQTHDLNLSSAQGGAVISLHPSAAAPAWSPSGKKLAFFGEAGISNLGGIYSQGNGIWVIDILDRQAQNPVQLVAQDHVRNITWSPDSTKLAFEVGLPNIPHEVIVVDAQDGRPISRFPGEQPAWSPDSQKIVVKGCHPDCGLWLFNFDGSGGSQITFGDTDSYPYFSPTGEYLAFTSQRQSEDWEIYLLRLADNELIRLTHRPGSDITPVFDRCGQNLYLRTDYAGSWWLTVMKLDGSGERKVLEGVGPSDDWGLARPAVY